jgi:hypothetical protein
MEEDVNRQLAVALCDELGWETPGSVYTLADRWVRELDASGVARAALIASVPSDETSVAAAVAKHPSRFVGFFMLDPSAGDPVAPRPPCPRRAGTARHLPVSRHAPRAVA